MLMLPNAAGFLRGKRWVHVVKSIEKKALLNVRGEDDHVAVLI
jgi:hypothetical protein